MPQQTVSAEELVALPLFEGENREAVEWIASLMELRSRSAGEVLIDEGKPVTNFGVILEVRFTSPGRTIRPPRSWCPAPAKRWESFPFRVLKLL